jgi:dTDP-glucose 4,6-dehydratase
MLEYARKHPELEMFINFSTDEVYGPAPDVEAYYKGANFVRHDYDTEEEYTEFLQGMDYIKSEIPHLAGYPKEVVEQIVDNGYPEHFYHWPSNPYSASKSAQEKIGIAYSNTYGVPVVTTHTMNLVAERQHPEKYVPKCINKILNGEKLTIHANADKTKAGTRFYLHARNLADAMLHIVGLGYNGYDEWNIAGLEEIDNLSLAKLIEEYVNEWQRDNGEKETKLVYEMTDFHSSRPGHDLRYALDSTKLLDSGYKYPVNFRDSLRKTVRWSLDNDKWLKV